MNKFLLTGLSLLTLAACTHDMDEWQEPNNDSQYKTVYLPLQFVTAGENVTRSGDASQEGTVAGSTGDTYKTSNNDLDLYFFDAKGTDFDFLNQQGLNMLDEKNIELTWTKGENNTYVSNYVLTLKMDEETVRPTQVVAILNHPSTFDIDKLEDESLDKLRKTVLENPDDYSNGRTEGGAYVEDMFMMSNSVYSDGTNAVYASAIDSDNFIEEGTYKSMTDEEHLAKAVPIYLERVVAKVSMAYGEESFSVKADASDGNYSDGSTVSVKAVVKGWNMVNKLNKTYLIKDIDGYSADWAWNSSDLHRCYWANYIPKYDLEEQTLKFKSDMINDGANEGNIYYPFENTLPSEAKDNNNREANTCAVITAQLCDDKGDPIELSYWNNTFYSSMTDLETALKEGFDAEGYTVPADAEIYYQIVKEEPYKVIPYIKGDYANTKDLLGEILLWGDGYCYYYQPIAHLSTSGLYGIVRNHWYKLTLSSLKGLGTPMPVYKSITVPVVYPDAVDPNNPTSDELVTEDNLVIDPTRPDYPTGGDWNVKLQVDVMPWQKESFDVIKFYGGE
jgi:hypothetical protein